MCAAAWGVLAKAAATRLDSPTTAFVSVMSASAIVAVGTVHQLAWSSPAGVVMGAVGGVLASIGSLVFYAALRRAPVSVVVPLSSLYLVAHRPPLEHRPR